jgi:2-polyprenyl-3-methyl-5-hydroxy-6-metoxy-1,4-benzoquinol methylase
MSNFVERSARFWDGHAEKYAKQPIKEPEAYEKKLEITRNYLTSESRVLEFGCGTGSTALLHAPRVQEILAIDSSPKMIEIANQRKSEAEAKNVTFEQATLFDLSDEDGSFDVILGMSILHLVEDLDGTLAKVASLLKPGGVFVSSTACVGHANFFLRWLLPLGGLFWLIPRVQVFDAKTLEAKLQHVGFEIEVSEMINKSGLTSFLVAKKL